MKMVRRIGVQSFQACGTQPGRAPARGRQGRCPVTELDGHWVAHALTIPLAVNLVSADEADALARELPLLEQAVYSADPASRKRLHFESHKRKRGQ